MHKNINEDDNFQEYDIFIDVDKNDIHLITYLLEAEPHMMNIRNRQENGYLKIIGPSYFLNDSLTLIDSLKTQAFHMEVVKVEPHNGVV